MEEKVKVESKGMKSDSQSYYLVTSIRVHLLPKAALQLLLPLIQSYLYLLPHVGAMEVEEYGYMSMNCQANGT